MKSKTLVAAAVVGAFAAGGAFANTQAKIAPPHDIVSPTSPAVIAAEAGHGLDVTMMRMSSAPVYQTYETTTYGTGATFDSSGSGTLGYDSSLQSDSSSVSSSDVGYDSAMSSDSGTFTSDNSDYWHMGESSGVGATSDSGYGSGSFDTAMNSFDTSSDNGLADEDYVALTDIYIVPAPLASYDWSTAHPFEVAPSDAEQLASVTDYYVITPIYDEAIDTTALNDTGDNSVALQMDNTWSSEDSQT